MILAWTGPELSCGQASDWRTDWHIHTWTHTHTQTQAMTIPQGQNWPRVKMHLKVSSAKWRSSWLCLNVLTLLVLQPKYSGMTSAILLTIVAPNTSPPFYQHELTWIPAWISNYIHYKVWDEITYPFSNVNGCTIEVWKWRSNFVPHFNQRSLEMNKWFYPTLYWVCNLSMLGLKCNPC